MSTKTKPTLPRSPNKSQPLGREAIFYMVLLALQFGFQPLLTRRYTSSTICRSSVIFVQECFKFCIALSLLYFSGDIKSARKDWTIYSWASVAGVPAALYAVQNLSSLLAYQNLDGLTYNILNQTKTLSAALCCYLVMGRRQSVMQVVALMVLLLSALIMERIIPLDFVLQGRSESSNNTFEFLSFKARHFSHGVAPVLLASFISGLAGAISQKNLQGVGSRNPYWFSMELCGFSIIFLSLSMIASPDGKMIQEKGFWSGWTLKTLIPIFTNSVGGIIVGLVTKYAGAVQKGFALIFGIFISGFVQAPDTGISTEQLIGGFLAGISLYMHTTNRINGGQVSLKSTKKD